MKKNLANEYCYSTNPNEDNHLRAIRGNHSYKTKMVSKDLPEWYCDVHRHWWTRNVINCSGVVDLRYDWVRENHFMKDSVLRISYTGEIEGYYPEMVINGKKKKSWFKEYTNVDTMVFGGEIFKALAWIRKYSGCDMSGVKKEFVKQCKWLKENEPEFTPDTDNFGKWFDKRLEKEWINED